MSTDAHATAFKTLLADVTKVPVYDLDEANTGAKAGTLPSRYVVIYLSPRFGGTTRLPGKRTNRGRRLTTGIAAPSTSDARLIEDRIDEAFAGRVDLGDVFTRVNYEAGGGSFEFEGQSYTANTDWTFRI